MSLVSTLPVGFSLPPERYERAIRYVCYERHFYYLYSGAGFAAYPLLYLDRFLGWRCSPGPEPLLPRADGLARFLDRHVRGTVRVTPDRLADTLADVFAAGHRAALDIWWAPHADGIEAVTSALVEGLSGDTALLTKINETRNRARAPMPLPDLVRQAARDDDGMLRLTVIRDSPVVAELTRLPAHRVFQRIFHDLYGYRLTGTGLERAGTAITPDTVGLDQRLAYLERAERSVVVDGAVPKPVRFQLNKAVQNCFLPIQFYLDCVLETPQLGGRLPAAVAARVRRARADMAAALDNLHRAASLLVQVPRSPRYTAYVAAFRALRAVQPDYQRANLDVLHALARPEVEVAR